MQNLISADREYLCMIVPHYHMVKKSQLIVLTDYLCKKTQSDSIAITILFSGLHIFVVSHHVHHGAQGEQRRLLYR